MPICNNSRRWRTNIDSKSDDAVVIRAAYKKYCLVGFWVLLAVVFYLISLRPVPIDPNIKIPRISFELLALFAVVFAVSWLFWVRSLKIAVSDGYMEYRNGFFKFRAPLNSIAFIEDEYVPMGEIIRTGRLPKFNVSMKSGNGVEIKTEPFRREDLFKIYMALKKAGIGKRTDFRVNSIWGHNAF